MQSEQPKLFGLGGYLDRMKNKYLVVELEVCINCTERYRMINEVALVDLIDVYEDSLKVQWKRTSIVTFIPNPHIIKVSVMKCSGARFND